jgi:hypothetical protein
VSRRKQINKRYLVVISSEPLKDEVTASAGFEVIQKSACVVEPQPPLAGFLPRFIGTGSLLSPFFYSFEKTE